MTEIAILDALSRKVQILHVVVIIVERPSGHPIQHFEHGPVGILAVLPCLVYEQILAFSVHLLPISVRIARVVLGRVVTLPGIRLRDPLAARREVGQAVVRIHRVEDGEAGIRGARIQLLVRLPVFLQQLVLRKVDRQIVLHGRAAGVHYIVSRFAFPVENHPHIRNRLFGRFLILGVDRLLSLRYPCIESRLGA